MFFLKYSFYPDLRLVYKGFVSREDKMVGKNEMVPVVRKSNVLLTSRCLRTEGDYGHILIHRDTPGISSVDEEELLMDAMESNKAAMLPLLEGKALAYYYLSPSGEIFEATDVDPVIYMPLPVQWIEPGSIWFASSPVLSGAASLVTEYSCSGGDEHDHIRPITVTFKTPFVRIPVTQPNGAISDVVYSRSGSYVFSLTYGRLEKVEHRMTMSVKDGQNEMETTEHSVFELHRVIEEPQDEYIDTSESLSHV